MSENTWQDEEAGNLTLDGTAWKNKSSVTYTSLLDLYDVGDLFTEEKTALYEEKRNREKAMQSELQDYVFVSTIEDSMEEKPLTEFLFSEKIELSKIQNYNTEKENSRISIVLMIIFAFLVFSIFLLEYSNRRKKRRKDFAVEINMENYRTGSRYS